jgi:transcription antitermination protein NusB
VATTRPSRKQARRDALFVLYQLEVTPLPVQTLLDNVKLSEGYEADEFTRRLVAGVLARREELDAVLESHSRDWSLARMAPLERNVLRLALYELRSGVTPPEVAIDEAVRLAKRYATDEAGALVNGILGGVAREEAETWSGGGKE